MVRRSGVLGGPKSGKLRRQATKVREPIQKPEEFTPVVVIVPSVVKVVVEEPVVEVIPEPVQKPISMFSFIREPVKVPEVPEDKELDAIEPEDIGEIDPEVMFGFTEEVPKKSKKEEKKEKWAKKNLLKFSKETE